MTYPHPGTAADSLLAFVQANPGCSKTALVRYANSSPANVQRRLTKLAGRGLVRVETDERGYHAIYPVTA